jgi:hypothetical protein
MTSRTFARRSASEARAPAQGRQARGRRMTTVTGRAPSGTSCPMLTTGRKSPRTGRSLPRPVSRSRPRTPARHDPDWTGISQVRPPRRADGVQSRRPAGTCQETWRARPPAACRSRPAPGAALISCPRPPSRATRSVTGPSWRVPR